jgi:hypothetical protein
VCMRVLVHVPARMFSSSVLTSSVGSLVQGALPECVLYGELVYTNKAFMRDVTPIKLDWLVEIVSHFAFWLYNAPF